jgi:phospholipase D1/2
VILLDNKWVYREKKRMFYYKLHIQTNSRVLGLKFDSKGGFKSWRNRLNKAIDGSPWSHLLNRFVARSFAPERRDNKVKLMIDGEMYFRSVAEELQRAESEIYISDWWLVPKYYLVRPVSLASNQDA